MKPNKYYAICDCDSCYCSCERVFRPDLNGKPVVVLRDTTERPEGVAAGTLKLAGTDENVIFSVIDSLLCDKAEYEKMAGAVNPYGDGFASVRIADAIIKKFSK